MTRRPSFCLVFVTKTREKFSLDEPKGDLLPEFFWLSDIVRCRVSKPSLLKAYRVLNVSIRTFVTVIFVWSHSPPTSPLTHTTLRQGEQSNLENFLISRSSRKLFYRLFIRSSLQLSATEKNFVSDLCYTLEHKQPRNIRTYLNFSIFTNLFLGAKQEVELAAMIQWFKLSLSILHPQIYDPIARS